MEDECRPARRRTVMVLREDPHLPQEMRARHFDFFYQ